MLKTFYVAWREFTSTIWTKGFIIGVLMTPLIMLVVAGAIALTKNLKGPRLIGSIAVIDESGRVAQGIKTRFSPEFLKSEKEQLVKSVDQTAKEGADKIGLSEDQAAMASGIAKDAINNALSKADLTIEELPPTIDLAAAKAALAAIDIHEKNRPEGSPPPRVAIAVVPAGAVTPSAEGVYTKFELFTAQKLDFEIQGRIENKIAAAIVDARITSDDRIQRSGLTPEDIRALVKEPDANTATLTKEGEKKNAGAAQFLLPMAFMLLLLMSVMTGGQYLLTSTVEEKSSRVMEVLLSAVSPAQLMIGKIVGQMCVGLVILTLYSGVAVASLIVFSFMHVLDPILLVYLFIFFFIAFFIIASMMAAVGSAVSEMREAQTMMTPIMVIIMLPWLLWMPISRAPNSLFSTIMSFVPGINPFVMMIRLTGSEPTPTWQIPVSILVGLISVVICAWGASKIFRIGVLMYGKPPNVRTLIKWIRMA